MSTAYAQGYPVDSYSGLVSYAPQAQYNAPAPTYAAPPVASDAGYTISAPIAASPVVVVASPVDTLDTIESQLNGILEMYQNSRAGKFEPRSITLKSPKTKVEKVKVISAVPGIYGQLEYKEQLIEQSVNQTKTVPKEVVEQFYQLDGTIGTRKIKIDQQEQDYDEVTIRIQKVPKGVPVSEFFAPENSAVSPELFNALKANAEAADTTASASIKAAFKSATVANWGPLPASYKPQGFSVVSRSSPSSSSTVAAPTTWNLDFVSRST
eukprot:CAMPEP_0113704292 /NCGR_PEP_ID=MMETSP0038_2-20120614/26424_1 /TAXON_ID=2898 /ORGANISM="Cryptomonas paramecium" /LENGTH=266 /DNA_ID=CAMNT_0000629029 /DNA_START=13 /DNA_END=813 /DNA_ORIENTATION=- /assembly_acc=CAM_ASM_000170